MSYVTIKSLSGSLKVESESDGFGIVTAKVTQYDVLHRDDSIIKKGAIADTQHIPVSKWNHSSVSGHDLPVGYAKLWSKGDFLMMEARYDLSDTDAKKSYDAIKRAGNSLEYSIGLRATKSHWEDAEGNVMKRPGWTDIFVFDKAKVYEASPVYAGASPGTGTISVKSLLPDDSTSSDDDVIKVKDEDELVVLKGRIATLETENSKLKEYISSQLEV